MTKLLVLYHKPDDPQAFDDYYHATHVPLAKKMPGLARYEINDGAMQSLAGDAGYHLIATLEFTDRKALDAALRSAEGRATAADVPNFATGGVEMIVLETKEV